MPAQLMLTACAQCIRWCLGAGNTKTCETRLLLTRTHRSNKGRERSDLEETLGHHNSINEHLLKDKSIRSVSKVSAAEE